MTLPASVPFNSGPTTLPGSRGERFTQRLPDGALSPVRKYWVKRPASSSRQDFLHIGPDDVEKTGRRRILLLLSTASDRKTRAGCSETAGFGGMDGAQNEKGRQKAKMQNKRTKNATAFRKGTDSRNDLTISLNSPEPVISAI
jgi:hypothetical protein